jgi:hypothetical protein
MVILFASFFLGIVSSLAKNRAVLPRWVIFAIVLYFALIEEIIGQFFTLHFAALHEKFVLYLVIVFPPLLLLISYHWKDGIRLTAGIILSFVALLPCTRPTSMFVRQASDWKISHFPIRYTENISQLPPDSSDIALLERDCNQLESTIKTRWIAHLHGATNCKGPTLAPKPIEFHSDQEWKALYALSKTEQRSEILLALQRQKNPLLIKQAVQNLNTNDDRLIISSVLYLREISGLGIGNDQTRWKDWLDCNSTGMRMSLMGTVGVTLIAEAGFSALQVQADLFDAQETGKDFLRIYLTNHFPRSIDDGIIEELKKEIKTITSDSQPAFYKKGILYFFLALAETTQFAHGTNQDPASIESDWRSALENLQQSRFLGGEIAKEIKKILQTADADGNGHLSEKELISIVNSRR